LINLSRNAPRRASAATAARGEREESLLMEPNSSLIRLITNDTQGLGETGPRMSKAVIHGDTVYLAGIVADSPKDKSIAEQTRSILSQIDGFLAMAGTNKTKLLSANIWITDMRSFAEMNMVWDSWV
jgi:enamine deaminase RidA (YjgF/YER057c/UK114 family)